MWRCVCGNVMRSVAHTCPECSRTFHDNIPFIDRMYSIEIALSLMSRKRTDIAEIEKLALDCLANDKSLLDIAIQLENVGNSAASDLARILRHLIV